MLLSVARRRAFFFVGAPARPFGPFSGRVRYEKTTRVKKAPRNVLHLFIFFV